MAWVKPRITSSGDKRFVACYRDPEGRTRSAGTTTSQRAAERAGNREEQRVLAGSYQFWRQWVSLSDPGLVHERAKVLVRRGSEEALVNTVLAVLAHPREDSFCGGLFNEMVRTIRSAGAELVLQDLYRDAFDPVLTGRESLAVAVRGAAGFDPEADALVSRYQADLARADRLVVVHPNWWGKPPAILSGWLDRVLAPGVAYKLDGGAGGVPSAQLKLSALIVTTGDTAHDRESREFGDPLSAMWERCVLPYIGAEEWARVHIAPVSDMSADERGQAVRHVGRMATQLLAQPDTLVSQVL